MIGKTRVATAKSTFVNQDACCREVVGTLRLRFLGISRELQTSRSHVTSTLPSGLQFQVYVLNGWTTL